MKKLFTKEHLPGLILNITTILIVAIMLLVSKAIAKPSIAQSTQSFSSGMLSYQGTLSDALGNPVTGSYDMTLRIYASASGSTFLWEESRSGMNAVPVNNGLFDLMLGSLLPIPSSVWEQTELYLGVKIGSDAEMTPREKLAVVPSAAMAQVAQLAISVPDASIKSRHFAPTVYEAFNTQSKFNSTNEWMPTGTTLSFTCEVDCLVHVVHRSLIYHSNGGRVVMNVSIDDDTFRILTEQSGWVGNVSGEGYFDLPAGIHDVNVYFAIEANSPGTAQYYGDNSGYWEHLYVVVYAQD
jgi:hypothetical protein